MPPFFPLFFFPALFDFLSLSLSLLSRFLLLFAAAAATAAARRRSDQRQGGPPARGEGGSGCRRLLRRARGFTAAVSLSPRTPPRDVSEVKTLVSSSISVPRLDLGPGPDLIGIFGSDLRPAVCPPLDSSVDLGGGVARALCSVCLCDCAIGFGSGVARSERSTRVRARVVGDSSAWEA